VTGRFTFPRAARLSRARDFRRVYQDGWRVHVAPLRVVALPREEGLSRLGLAVGRKVGRAVVRNRWKRAIREAFRLWRHTLARPFDMVVSVEWDAGPERVREVPDAMRRAIELLNARVQEGGRA